MTPARIGLLGGTFNPVHKGHLHIAGEVLQRLELKQVFFIPSNIPPHKDLKEIAPAKDRLAMLRLALSAYPRFKLCDIELKHPGPSYTVETLQRLKKVHPKAQLFFIIGMDAFGQIMHWETPDLLLELCHFAILSRPDYPFSQLPEHPLFKAIDRPSLSDLDAGKEQFYSISVVPQQGLHFIQIPPSSISASEIRRAFSQAEGCHNAGERKRLPHSVESYIIENKIYQGDNYFYGCD